jgi:hypothetical protein
LPQEIRLVRSQRRERDCRQDDPPGRYAMTIPDRSPV